MDASMLLSPAAYWAHAASGSTARALTISYRVLLSSRFAQLLCVLPDESRMKVAMALTVFVACAAGSAVAARFGAREEWELWHAHAQRRLQQTASAGRAGDAPERRMMSESLALHLRARELLHDTDLPTSMLRKFHEGLDAHAGLMDQALALSPQEQANAADMLRVAASAGEYMEV